MTPTQVTPESASSVAPARLAATRMIAAADANEVMREQIEYLIEHAQGGDCGCSRCETYHRVRTLLLAPFI